MPCICAFPISLLRDTLPDRLLVSATRIDDIDREDFFRLIPWTSRPFDRNIMSFAPDQQIETAILE
jgi:hypothetical protein